MRSDGLLVLRRATYRSGPVTRLFMVHLTPLRPGVSRSFFQLCFKTTVKPNWKSKLLSKLPKPSWLSGPPLTPPPLLPPMNIIWSGPSHHIMASSVLHPSLHGYDVIHAPHMHSVMYRTINPMIQSHTILQCNLTDARDVGTHTLILLYNTRVRCGQHVSCSNHTQGSQPNDLYMRAMRTI